MTNETIVRITCLECGEEFEARFVETDERMVRITLCPNCER